MKPLAVVAGLAAIAAAVSLLALAAGAGAPAKAPEKAPDVLIIHAAGTPFQEYDTLTPANIDAVSCPTPVVLNCKTVAEEAAEALRAKGLQVRVVETADIRHRDELLRPRLVVLASPTYFGTCSWRMHKLLNEPVWQIFHLAGKRLDGRPFAFIATARREANWKGAIDAMRGAVKSANGTPGPAMGVAIDAAPAQVKERAAKFADEVAAVLNPGK